MKITWERDGKAMIGKVGDIACFQMIADGDWIELTSDLPETLPGQYGRYVVRLPTVHLAATEAGKLLKNWEIRFNA